MKRKQQRNSRNRKIAHADRAHGKRARAGTKLGRRKRLRLAGKQLHSMKIADFYRPLKKPVTLRLDADVLAWFKKDGRRYQTRINAALRRVMAREMKEAGWPSIPSA